MLHWNNATVFIVLPIINRINTINALFVDAHVIELGSYFEPPNIFLTSLDFFSSFRNIVLT
jgi:prepilin-type processing-associated H-X9-DG protein